MTGNEGVPFHRRAKSILDRETQTSEFFYTFLQNSSQRQTFCIPDDAIFKPDYPLCTNSLASGYHLELLPT